MSTISLRLPNSLHEATKKLAKKEHVSINQLITLAVAEKLSCLGAEDFLEKRAKRGNRSKYLEVLNSAPDAPSIPEDKI